MTINVGASTATGTYPITVTGTGGGVQQSATVTLTVTTASNFTLSASPGSLSVARGNQGTSTISTAVSSGFNSSISLSASGVPTGTTVSFSPNPVAAPGAGNSTMTINVGASTATGTYPITVTGTGGGVQQSASVTLTVTAGTTTISYVQGNYATPQAAQSTVSVAFTAAQVAGDLNVVTVGWNDSTAIVNTVIDAKGNIYTRAVGPTIFSGALSQSIYYAKNIAAAAAGANTVTVTFSTAAAYPDIRILEYSGADPNNPVDVTAANFGNSNTSVSGSATTTNPTDLLFGANTVVTATIGPGSGFTNRLLTAPDGDIAEDQMVAATGSYSAAAPLSSAGAWIMQMVAFRTGSGSATPNFTLSPSPASLSVGQGSQGTSTISTAVSGGFNSSITLSASGVPTGTTVSFSPNTIPAPGGGTSTMTIMVGASTLAGTYPIVVTGNGGGIQQSTTVTLAVSGFLVSPRVAVLTPTQTQQFTATSGFGTITWSVDGVVGGSPSSGTITINGLYTPPSSVGTHTVTASTTQSLSANAKVYVTNYSGTFTHHNDNLRTGQNINETVLSPANVNQAQFGKLFTYSLDGIPFASPLYVANVSIPGKGLHNVVYVATEHDSVYAWDADGLSTSPLWKVSFLGSGITTVPCGDTGECGDIPNEIGITGTPVIDQASGTLYVVAKTKEGVNYVQRLHALDIATGAEKFGGPRVIQSSVSGSGEGSQGGQLSFDPLRENQRPAILLSNGNVYIGWGSHGDQHPWHGWVIAYNASTLQQAAAYCVSPDGYGGGIWASGGGLGADSSGNIFFNTGNGDFTGNAGGRDYGDTIVKLNPSGSVLDYFTPHDQSNMESQDLDLSSAGPVLLLDQPGAIPHLLIAAAKTGTIFVVNRDNMGHFRSGNDTQIVQSLVGILPNGTLEEGNFSAPAFFNGYVYFAAVNDTLKAFQLSNGLLSNGPTSHSLDVYPNRGGSFAVSGNGNANGIVWAVQDNNPQNGVLHAYDAGNLANEFYNSSKAGSRDNLGVATKFSIPLVANGKVFVGSQSQLVVYGLLP